MKAKIAGDPGALFGCGMVGHGGMQLTQQAQSLN
jgi:hypothetical protein